jgi:MoxR-like ATPase
MTQKDSATLDAQLDQFRRRFHQLKTEVGKVIVGQADIVEHAIIAMVAGGHVLLEGVPGLGKTLLVRSLAGALHLRFQRIQFTPDLMPADLIGTNILIDDGHGHSRFEFSQGPIFCNLLLGDEINRATPKTQSALLEVMDRGKVTVDGQTHAVGAPFMVFATQNPVDYEGTFPLPESQTDRFLMRLQMGYPQSADELDILRTASLGYDAIEINPVVTRGDVIKLQALARQVFVEDSVLEFILKIVGATRTEAEFRAGISVRGGLALRCAAQARALVQGRDFVVPEDVTEMTAPVCAHRLVLARPAGDALEERRTVVATLKRILSAIPAPV